MAFNLSAVLNFSTKGVKDNLSKTNAGLTKLKSNFDTAAKRASNVGRGLRNVALAGTVMTAGMGKVIGSYMDFQKQMDSVKAKMRPTEKEFSKMTDLAKELGATTIFTAKQSAEGLEFLALAGFSARDAMSVLPTILNTAAAGALDLGSASDIITDSMSAMAPVMTKFGSKQKQAINLADMMALAQAKTNTNIQQLGEAIKFGGGAMANMGIPLNQIIGSMGALADAGIKGSSGGTALVNMMGKLAKVSSKGQKHLEDMGISMDDIQTKGADGKTVLKDMASVMEVFATALNKNPKALEKAGIATELFGKRGQRAFFALQNKGGANLRKLFGQLANSSKMMDKGGKVVGASAAMAEIMTDNIFGAWESFKSATSGIQINLGEMMSRFFDIKGGLQAITTPLQNFSMALQNAMKPTDEWSDAAKRLMKTPIGQFALGVAEGFKEVKATVVELIADFKAMISETGDGAVNFKEMGKMIAKLVVGLALVGPPLLAIGGFLLFLMPIITAVVSAVGLIGSAISIVWGIVTTVIPLMAAIISLLLTPIGLVVAAIVGIGTVIYLFRDQILSVFGMVVGALQNIWSSFSESMTNLWSGIFNVAMVMGNKMITFFQPIADGIQSMFINAWNNIKSVFSTVGGFLMDAVMAPFKAMFSLVQTLMTKLASTWIGKKALKVAGIDASELQGSVKAFSEIGQKKNISNVIDLSAERAKRRPATVAEGQVGGGLGIAGTKPELLSTPAERLRQEHLEATQVSVGGPTVNVSPAPVNLPNQQANFEVINTFDGDSIHTSIKKKERSEKLQSGTQLSDDVLDGGQQVSYGS